MKPGSFSLDRSSVGVSITAMDFTTHARQPLLGSTPSFENRVRPWLLTWSVASTISAVFLALALLRQQATTHAASHTQVLAVRETTATAAIPGTKRVFERFDVLFHHQGDAAGLVWTDKPAWQRAWEPFFVDDFTCTKLELNPSLLPCPL